MDPNNQKPLGKKVDLIDALHRESKLPTLRTYQGDMATFIKEKNESVISVAVKEKEREERRQAESKRLDPKIGQIKLSQSVPEEVKVVKPNFNFTPLVLGLLLLLGGGVTIFYAFQYWSRTPVVTEVATSPIMRTDSTVKLVGIDKGSLIIELGKLAQSEGLKAVSLSNQETISIDEAPKLFDLIGVPESITLRRTLRDQFLLGTLTESNSSTNFLILTIDDFGRAFASMLEWESTLTKDLPFLVATKSGDEKSLAWRDVIVKNKDARALIDTKGNSLIVYTFLDKNTLLVASNLSLLDELVELYRTRSVVR